MNSEMSYVVQCASACIFSEPAFKTSVIQSTYQCPSSASKKITVLTSSSISVAASDGECHAISTDWESSDLHIDFASEFSMISVILNLEVLLLHQWQGVICVQTPPSAISVHVFIHQFELSYCKNTVTTQSSAMQSKEFIAVQFTLQWLNQFSCSEGQ